MPPPLVLTPEDEKLVAKIASMIERRQLSAPAIMVLEMGRPLNFVASQFLVFLRPFATMLLNPKEYERFVAILEHREGIEVLIRAIASESDRARQDSEPVPSSPPKA